MKFQPIVMAVSDTYLKCTCSLGKSLNLGTFKNCISKCLDDWHHGAYNIEHFVHKDSLESCKKNLTYCSSDRKKLLSLLEQFIRTVKSQYNLNKNKRGFSPRSQVALFAIFCYILLYFAILGYTWLYLAKLGYTLLYFAKLCHTLLFYAC